MVLNTRKVGHTMFYRPSTVCAEYLKSGFHGRFKAARHLPTRIRAEADFVIADTVKGNFIVVEAKKGVEPVSTQRAAFDTLEYLGRGGRIGKTQAFLGLMLRQKALYMRMPFMIQKHSVENRLERLEEQFNNLVSSTWSYLFSERDIEEMRELSKGMLEGSKKMRELAEQLQEVDDEG